MKSILSWVLTRPEKTLPDQLKRKKDLEKKLRKRAINDAPFVVFDTELTGLDFKRDSIISIGALQMLGGRILPAKNYYRLVKPETELKHQSVVVHEITHSDLDLATPLEDAITEFLDFIDSHILIGHFVHIDLNFVNKALKKLYGRGLQNQALDTSTLHDWLYENSSHFARHFSGKTVQTDLFSLAKKYAITVDKAHNALGDAYVTAQLFQRFLPFLPECGVNTVKELLAISKP